MPSARIKIIIVLITSTRIEMQKSLVLLIIRVKISHSAKRCLRESKLRKEPHHASLLHRYPRRYCIRRSEQPTRSLCACLRDIQRRTHCEMGSSTDTLTNPRNRCIRIGSSFTISLYSRPAFACP